MLTSSIFRLNAEAWKLPPLLALLAPWLPALPFAALPVVPGVSMPENRIVISSIWTLPPEELLFDGVAPFVGVLPSALDVLGVAALLDVVPSAAGWELGVADDACVNC